MKICIAYATASVFMVALIAVPLALLRSECVNNLVNHPDWSVSKLRVEMELMGRQSYLTGTQALAGNRLHLDAWHGYHELINRQSFRPEAVEFSFYLADDAWLCFIFNRRRVFEYDNEQYNALRFSTNPHKPSAYLSVNAAGEFLDKTPIDTGSLLRANARNKCNISWEGSGIAVTLNDHAIGVLNCPSIGSQHIGFRGGANPASVDYVRVEQKEGKPYRTYFSRYEGLNRKRIWTSIIRHSTCIALILFLAIGVMYFVTRQLRTAAAVVIAVCATIALTLWPWLAYDRYIMARRYPIVDNQLIDVERDAVEQWTQSVKEALSARYPIDEHPEGDTIILIGTSQTWGSGASLRAQSWANLLEKYLWDLNDGIGEIAVMNAAVPGSNSGELLPLYQEFLSQYRHDVLLISLGCNDKDLAAFQENLAQFFALARQHGAHPMLLTEALSMDQAAEGPEFTPDMGKIAQAHDVPWLNLHEALRDRHDDGFLWWDVVHPTSFGHRCIAEIIMPFVMTNFP